MTLSELAYEAYRAHTGGISLASGQPIPAWDALKPEIQEAWGASTNTLVTTVRLKWIKDMVSPDVYSEMVQFHARNAAPVVSALVKEYLA